MKLSHQIDISCTPEQVWYWLGTPERAMVWQMSVGKTEIIQKTPDWIGTTFRETVEENGRGVEMQGVVTDYRENRKLAMHLSSKFHMVDVEWQLEEIKKHTRLDMSADIRFKSFLKLLSLLLWPAFKKNALAQSRKELERLKELCEQDT